MPKFLKKIKQHKWKSIAIALLALLSISYISGIIYLKIYTHRELQDFKEFVQSWEKKGERINPDHFFTSPESLPSKADDFHQHPAFLAELATKKNKLSDTGHINGLNDYFSLQFYTTNPEEFTSGYLTNIDQWLSTTPDKSDLSNLSERDTAQQILKLLSPLDSRLQALSGASKRPAASYLQPLAHYEKSMQVHTLEQSTISLLTRRAVLLALVGHQEKSLQDLSAAIRICKHSESSACLLGATLTNLFYNELAQSINIILATHQFSEPNLAILQKQLNTLSPQPSILRAIRGEISFFCTQIINLQNNPKNSSEKTTSAPGNSFLENLNESWQEYKISKAPAAYLIHLQLSEIRAITDNVLYSENTCTSTISPTQIKWILKQSKNKDCSYYSRIFTAVLLIHSDLKSTRVAIAIERYKLWNTNYPKTLNALIPEFLAKLPTDIYTSQPLHYRLHPDGTPVLYSVGSDLTDNQGSDDDIFWKPTPLQ